MIWKWLMVLKGWIRKALQKMVDCWNSLFDVAEEIVIDFCFYISPFPSTMLTARHLHAAALPLKSFVYGPLRGRRSAKASLSLSLAKGRRILDSPPDA
jgi:hypothetical protein